MKVQIILTKCNKDFIEFYYRINEFDFMNGNINDHSVFFVDFIKVSIQFLLKKLIFSFILIQISFIL